MHLRHNIIYLKSYIEINHTEEIMCHFDNLRLFFNYCHTFLIFQEISSLHIHYEEIIM